MYPISPFVDLLVLGELATLFCMGGILVCLVLADLWDTKNRRNRH